MNEPLRCHARVVCVCLRNFRQLGRHLLLSTHTHLTRLSPSASAPVVAGRPRPLSAAYRGAASTHGTCTPRPFRTAEASLVGEIARPVTGFSVVPAASFPFSRRLSAVVLQPLLPPFHLPSPLVYFLARHPALSRRPAPFPRSIVLSLSPGIAATTASPVVCRRPLPRRAPAARRRSRSRSILKKTRYGCYLSGTCCTTFLFTALGTASAQHVGTSRASVAASGINFQILSPLMILTRRSNLGEQKCACVGVHNHKHTARKLIKHA